MFTPLSRPHFGRLGRVMACGAFATALAVVSGGAVFAQQLAPASEGKTAEVVVPVRSLGRDDAPVTIDLYESFLCDECAVWRTEELPQLRRDLIDTGKARLVFHDVPMEPMAVSVRAAMIGLCAAPSHFFDASQALMSGLPALRQGERIGVWFEKGIAASGREKSEMDACTESEVIYEQVRLQAEQANAQNIQSLPAFMINGERQPLYTAAFLASAVATSQHKGSSHP